MTAQRVVERMRVAQQLGQHTVPGRPAFRAQYALRQRAGFPARELPLTTWQAQPLAGFVSDSERTPAERLAARRATGAPRFFFAAAARPGFARAAVQWDPPAQDPPPSIVEAERLLAGAVRFFGHQVVHTGFPPAWQRNALTGQELPDDVHWSRLSEFGYGDIKLVWEPSRFSFAFTLVRAYARSGDERYAEAFWQAVEDWRAHNPPQAGPNWKCGQETSLRVLAWCFGLYGFLDAAATTPERLAALVQMIAVSGRRIENNLAYALSQRNNHGISEATGLWTIGLLFPELKAAARWKARGRALLESLALDLIYADGAFVQHSFNYQRLMLHDYLWALRLGAVAGEPLSANVYARVAAAADFLYQLQDETSGRVPTYGAMDGALLLPLSNCDFGDYRPVLQAAALVTTGKRRYTPGPWDEESAWLCGVEALAAPVEAPARSDFAAPVGGYYTLRSATGFAFTRCAGFRDRPSQADMLHVDLWWRGQNIAIDPGSYAYNAPAPWDGALGGTAVHNTVTVDGLDQMERRGRFLWLPWLHGRVVAQLHNTAADFCYWQGEHDGYTRLAAPVVHKRAILRVGGETWIIIDDLRGAGSHSYRLHWLLNDFPAEFAAARTLALQTTAGPYYVHLPAADNAAPPTLVRAEPAGVRGWQAPYYQARQPALSLAAEYQSTAPEGGATSSAIDGETRTLLFTTFSAGKPCSMLRDGVLLLQLGAANITLFPAAPGAAHILAAVARDGIKHPLT